MDAETLVFPSTAVDPNQPISPEIAQNGNIYNVWTLNLKTNELKQYTDALGGNVSPVVLRDEEQAQRIAFITYYKGEYGIHTVPAQKEALHTVAQRRLRRARADHRLPAARSATRWSRATSGVKGRFEKLFLEGRPPVNVGVTSGGDFFGGTQVTFTDVLGDQQFNFYAESVSQYRTLSFSYLNLSRRLQYALQGFSQTQFYYANDAGTFYAAQYGFLSHDDALSTQTVARRHGVRHLPAQSLRPPRAVGRPDQLPAGIRRPEPAAGRRRVSAGGLRTEPVRERQPDAARDRLRPRDDGVPRDTGRCRATRCGSATNSRRKSATSSRARPSTWTRASTSGSRPTACSPSASAGSRAGATTPYYLYSGGNSELRGYEYLEFIGNKAFFANAELRFPVIEAALTPLGVIGGLRAVAFVNLGASQFARTTC